MYPELVEGCEEKKTNKARDCMNNVEDMEGFEINTSIKKKKMFILFIVCINCLFICSMLKYYFVLNGIVEIASVCPMLMEEDPSIVVLDDVE